LDRHPERVGDQRRGRGGVDGPADHPTLAGVQHDRAVQLAFAGGVLGDVGDPQMVWAGAGELAVGRFAVRLERPAVATFPTIPAGAVNVVAGFVLSLDEPP
jgi:hypothetical protein